MNVAGVEIGGGVPCRIKSDEDFFWERVLRADDDQCWIWHGRFDGVGYGTIRRRSGERARGAHRLSWEIHFGAIPDGMFICHHCDNRACVNPNHLFLGTQADNLRDAQRKGRLSVASKGKANRRKTHCPQGHPYGDTNTMWAKQKSGGVMRKCRTCHRERMSAYNDRHREEINRKAREYRAMKHKEAA